MTPEPARRRCTWLFRSAAVMTAAAGLVVGAACGNEQQPDPQPAKDLASLAAYCESIRALANTVAGSDSPALPRGAGINAGAALAAVNALGPLFEQLVEVAPDEIRGDVNTVSGAIRAASAGDLAPAAAPAYESARVRLAEFSAAECPGGSASGDL